MSQLTTWMDKYLPSRDPYLAGQPNLPAEKNRMNSMMVLLAIAAVGVFYLATIRTGHDWGDDFSLYIQHARNIAEGTGYKTFSYIHNPPYVGPDSYPPVFPVMLALVYKFFGLNLTAMKAEIILLFLLSLFLLTLILKNELTVWYQLALVLLIGANPYFWDLKDQVISEIPFLVTFYLSIYLVHKAYRPEVAGWMKLMYVLLIGISFYLAYGTRSVGLVLFPSLLLYDLLRSRRPTLFAAGAVALAVSLILLQSYLFRSDKGYYDQFQADSAGFFFNWMKYIWMNLKNYFTMLTEVWDNGYSKTPRLILTLVISLLALVGFMKTIRRNISMVEIVVMLYVVMVIVVPMQANIRYLLPIVPFYVFYALQGVCNLPFGAINRKVAVQVLAVAVLVSYAAKFTKQDFTKIPNGITKAESVDFFNYVRQQTNENDVAVFLKPRLLALLTGRKTSFYPVLSDDKGVWAYFQKIKASIAVIGPPDLEAYDRQFLVRFIDKYKENFEVVYSNADFKVYRIVGIPHPYGRIDYERFRFTDPIPEAGNSIKGVRNEN